MAHAIALLVLNIQGATFAQSTNLAVFHNSTQIGSAEMTRELTADGKLITGITMTLRSASETATVIQQSEYNAHGYPTKKFQKQIRAGATDSITVSFKGSVATVIIENKGSTREFRVTAPTGAETRALSEFWFIEKPPAIGEKYSYYRFDMSLQRWTKTTVECIRKEEIQVAGKKLQAFCVIYDGVQGWADEKGKPLRLFLPGNVKLEWTGK